MKGQTMKLPSGVEYTVVCEPCEFNARIELKECGEETIAWVADQLSRGNQWAWCDIVVTAEWRGVKGKAYLGACSYESKEQFIESDDYYSGMKEDAAADLLDSIRQVLDQADDLRKGLGDVAA